MTFDAMKSLFGYAATTSDVTVRVAVSYLPEQSEPGRGRWFWAYHIRIENDGSAPVQLLTRHWIITDGRGARHSVEGEGVVVDGEERVGGRKSVRAHKGDGGGMIDARTGSGSVDVVVGGW